MKIHQSLACANVKMFTGSVRSSRGGRLFEDRYNADNEFAVDSLVESGRNLPFQNHHRLSDGELNRTDSSRRRPLFTTQMSLRKSNHRGNVMPGYVQRDYRQLITNFIHHNEMKSSKFSKINEQLCDDNDIPLYDRDERYNPFRVAEEYDRLLR